MSELRAKNRKAAESIQIPFKLQQAENSMELKFNFPHKDMDVKHSFVQ